jgi:hypothetical protein
LTDFITTGAGVVFQRLLTWHILDPLERVDPKCSSSRDHVARVELSTVFAGETQEYPRLAGLDTWKRTMGLSGYLLSFATRERSAC